MHIKMEAFVPVLAFVLLFGGCGLSQERMAIWKTKKALSGKDGDLQELSEVRGELKKIIQMKLQAAQLLESANRMLGRKYMEMGSYNLAEEAFREAEYLKPNNAYIKMDLGECCYFLAQSAMDGGERAGYLVRSREYYKKAIELKPDLTEARYGYGLLLFFGFADMHEAIKEMKKVLEYEPEHIEAHFALGRFYYEAGETNKALGEYLALTRILPKGTPRRKKAEENIERINREQLLR